MVEKIMEQAYEINAINRNTLGLFLKPHLKKLDLKTHVTGSPWKQIKKRCKVILD